MNVMRAATFSVVSAVCVCWLGGLGAEAAPPGPGTSLRGTVDFNRDIRPILSNNCFQCHGPDEKERKGELRLDTEEGALADLGGHAALVRGKPEESELVRRIRTTAKGKGMPPRKTGKTLTPREIDLLTRWIKEGAPYARHWAYVKPTRPALPAVKDRAWSKNPIDQFLLARLEAEGLRPALPAERHALVRRLALDLTGLPPSAAEVEAFLKDASPAAYEKMVDRFLTKEAYGEHWARMWLDLARYADSAGYANDPARTIWAYRDYVIQAFNANMPFDQFTIEQVAGDLLPQPTADQRIATAFHRNTLTNSEGGTNDEEYRNVAIVDRVNTTLTVWMGTSIACAQCHTHKYDPLTQKEFFQLFAILNQTEDSDRADEQPLHSFFTPAQQERRARWEAEIATLEKRLKTLTPELLAGQAKWEQRFPRTLGWHALKPGAATSRGGANMKIQDDGSVVVAAGQKTDTYTVELPLAQARLAALRLEALPHASLPGKGPGHAPGGNFVLSHLTAVLVPPQAAQVPGRFVRIELPGQERILSLAEVQVFRGTENVALRGVAAQSSTAFDGEARRAIDGITNGNYYEKNSVTHTAVSANPWWEVDLKTEQPLDRITLWNRTDGGVGTRLSNFRVLVLNEKRQPVWEQPVTDSPNPHVTLDTSGVRPVPFTAAFADYTQGNFDAASVLDAKEGKKRGWAIGPETGKPHTLTLLPANPVQVPPGAKLVVTLAQVSTQAQHTLGHFRLSVTDEASAADYARAPASVLAALATNPEKRTAAQRTLLTEHFLEHVATALRPDRDRLATLRKQLADLKPTTVPVLKELTGAKRRTTRLQFRGNFLDLGEEVHEGVPAVFHPLPKDTPPNRLALAGWLVDENNPLTARVVANRYWEQIFGTGLVRTSEEFGSQGELPSHPELLDWLATELIQRKWDLKSFVKLLVTSAAYRQSSRVTPEPFERDPENRLLARGPRVRLSAEMVRDQALFVSGLLSRKLGGPSVKPPQPALGVSAAFGGAIDWKTSEGEDRHRRGLYTEWRRTNPYPSMATFDAPNREICTVRRTRTNTPLQALVTLNDPVYVEASQALARRMIQGGTTPAERINYGIRLCLSRPASEAELRRLVSLYDEIHADLAQEPTKAKQVATNPLGPTPTGENAVEVASWTVVANVLLNLDEMFLKR